MTRELFGNLPIGSIYTHYMNTNPRWWWIKSANSLINNTIPFEDFYQQRKAELFWTSKECSVYVIAVPPVNLNGEGV